MGVITKCYTYDISNNKSLFDFTVGLWYYIHASGTMPDGIAEVGYFACGAGGRRFESCQRVWLLVGNRCSSVGRALNFRYRLLSTSIQRQTCIVTIGCIELLIRSGIAGCDFITCAFFDGE